MTGNTCPFPVSKHAAALPVVGLWTCCTYSFKINAGPKRDAVINVQIADLGDTANSSTTLEHLAASKE